MQQRYQDQFKLEIANLGLLPFYDQDIEDNPPAAVTELNNLILKADGVVIITPEFNWSISSVLKNAIDWLSRGDQPLKDKPVLTAGVTTGMLGTIRAQLHLREILSSTGVHARVLPPAGNEVLITFAKQKFDEDSGLLVDEATLQFLDGVVGRYIEFIRKA